MLADRAGVENNDVRSIWFSAKLKAPAGKGIGHKLAVELVHLTAKIFYIYFF